MVSKQFPFGFPLDDRLVLFGYGLFETIRVEEYGPTCLQRHYQRMQRGAVCLGLEMPEFSDWTGLIDSHLAQSSWPTPPFALRVTLSGGSPELPSRFVFHVRPISYTPFQHANGVAINFLSAPRNEQSPLCSFKTTNYLENLLGRDEAKRAGFFEGLWCNTRGFLVEGTMSNLFFVRAGELYTPSLTCGCLPGTRRALILESAVSMGIKINEGEFERTDLQHAEEVFLTNALMGVMPVAQVDNACFSVAPKASSSLTRRLEQALKIALLRRSQ